MFLCSGEHVLTDGGKKFYQHTVTLMKQASAATLFREHPSLLGDLLLFGNILKDIIMLGYIFFLTIFLSLYYSRYLFHSTNPF